MRVRCVRGIRSEAARQGDVDNPLYRWTKDTIEDPAKKEKYLKSFTLHVGGQEVYAKEIADALEADLQPLVGSGPVARMYKHDTEPGEQPAGARTLRLSRVAQKWPPVFAGACALRGCAAQSLPTAKACWTPH